MSNPEPPPGPPGRVEEGGGPPKAAGHPVHQECRHHHHRRRHPDLRLRRNRNREPTKSAGQPSPPREPDTTHPAIGFRGKDVRIPNTTPEQLAKALLRGGSTSETGNQVPARVLTWQRTWIGEPSRRSPYPACAIRVAEIVERDVSCLRGRLDGSPSESICRAEPCSSCPIISRSAPDGANRLDLPPEHNLARDRLVQASWAIRSIIPFL